MEKKRHFISLKTKIMLSTLIPVIVSFLLICSVIFIFLFHSLHESAKAELQLIGQRHAISFESKINNAMNYLSIVASNLELQVETGTTDREMLQKTVLKIFDDYKQIDGSSIYFEPDLYDGRDAEYSGSDYGTALSGRICYYFYSDEGQNAYLPEGLRDDIEFTLPHYTEAKEANRPIYTEPAVHVVNGNPIPMFTLTYPINDSNGDFIGAVTVDLFLEDLYYQLKNEQIYDTGYVIITNDKDQVIYSPDYEHIGMNRKEAGLDYALPSENETLVVTNTKSAINSRDILLTIRSIYIPQLDSFFYISVAAPMNEINAGATRLLIALIIFSDMIIVIIALLMYYRINKITAPIKIITEEANRIADGDLEQISVFISDENNKRAKDEIYTLSLALKKMLLQLNEGQKSKLEALEMKHKKEKAEAQAQAKNDFLAKMSHEIRTPMNAVMGMIELILRKNLPQDLYEDALIIKASSTNLLAIINDILDFSKIESGMLEVNESDYLFPSLINDVINVIRIRLVDKPVLFLVNIDSKVPAALIGDEVRIRQILINLLSNAVKYTDEGFISLTVSARTSLIDGGDDEGNVMLTIAVSDSGSGIKAGDIDKLFGNFVQVDAIRNKEIEGTGLGLAIARNLCQLMNGDITVSSEYGKGSIFTVSLPQKFDTYKPFASVDNSGGKSVLLYETRQVYEDTIASALDDLGVDYKIVKSIPSLFENLGRYPYVFISSFMYDSVNPTLSKLDQKPELVLLSDITDMRSPRDVRILNMPAHTLSIANILNDICEDYREDIVSGASFNAPEAKVLVVDDIAANLKVGEGLLLPYEMQVTLCGGGREAVALIAANRYDLVFMDHMMPEMDGLEATGCIRAMEGAYFRSVPIIALTANAISGVREMFIQNGMNDFLAKPIETAKLNAILEKWIPREKQKKNKQSAAQNEEKNTFVETLRTIPGLSVDKALVVVEGSKQSYERIVKLSVRLLPDNIKRLDHCLAEDLPGYAIEVHGVKGVLNNIGAYELGKAAYELEERSRNGDLEACKQLHSGFINQLNEFYDRITVIMSEAETLHKPEGNITLLSEALPKLLEAADFFDSLRALEILTDAGKCFYGKAVDQLLENLSYAFEQFDFDRALELIEKLKEELDKHE